MDPRLQALGAQMLECIREREAKARADRAPLRAALARPQGPLPRPGIDRVLASIPEDVRAGIRAGVETRRYRPTLGGGDSSVRTAPSKTPDQDLFGRPERPQPVPAAKPEPAEDVHRRRAAIARAGADVPSLTEQARELTAACVRGRWKQACVIVERLIGRIELGEWRPDQLFQLPGRVQYADAPEPLRDRIEALRVAADRARRRSDWPADESHWIRRDDPRALSRARALARRCGL